VEISVHHWKEWGGGLFLFTYFLCIIVIGIPILIGELSLGRSSQRAAIGAFATLTESKPTWKVAGYFGVIASFLIMSFYSIIAGWGMSYILMSLSGFYHNLSASEMSHVFETLSQSGKIMSAAKIATTMTANAITAESRTMLSERLM